MSDAPSPRVHPGLALPAFRDEPEVRSSVSSVLAAIADAGIEIGPACVLPPEAADGPMVPLDADVLALLADPGCALLATHWEGATGIACAFPVRGDETVAFAIDPDRQVVVSRRPRTIGDLIGAVAASTGTVEPTGDALDMHPDAFPLLVALSGAGLGPHQPVDVEAVDALVTRLTDPRPDPAAVIDLLTGGDLLAVDGGWLTVTEDGTRWWPAFNGHALQLCAEDGPDTRDQRREAIFVGPAGRRLFASRPDPLVVRLLEVTEELVIDVVELLLLRSPLAVVDVLAAQA